MLDVLISKNWNSILVAHVAFFFYYILYHRFFVLTINAMLIRGIAIRALILIDREILDKGCPPKKFF